VSYEFYYNSPLEVPESELLTEINLPEKRLDFIYGLQDQENEYILHLDFQLRHERDLPLRMHIYNLGLTAIPESLDIAEFIAWHNLGGP